MRNFGPVIFDRGLSTSSSTPVTASDGTSVQLTSRYALGRDARITNCGRFTPAEHEMMCWATSPTSRYDAGAEFCGLIYFTRVRPRIGKLTGVATVTWGATNPIGGATLNVNPVSGAVPPGNSVAITTVMPSITAAYFGLYDAAGTLVASTTNRVADFTLTHQEVRLPFQAAVVNRTPTIYYIAHVWVGSNSPIISKFDPPNAQGGGFFYPQGLSDVGLLAAPWRRMTLAGTSLPSSVTWSACTRAKTDLLIGLYE